MYYVEDLRIKHDQRHHRVSNAVFMSLMYNATFSLRLWECSLHHWKTGSWCSRFQFSAQAWVYTKLLVVTETLWEEKRSHRIFGHKNHSLAFFPSMFFPLQVKNLDFNDEMKKFITINNHIRIIRSGLNHWFLVEPVDKLAFISSQESCFVPPWPTYPFSQIPDVKMFTTSGANTLS